MNSEEKNKPIEIKGIYLRKLTFSINKIKPKEKIDFHTKFKLDKLYFDDDRTLIIIFGMELDYKSDDNDILISVEYGGEYHSDNIDELKKFSDYGAIAIMVPYLREAITSVSAKSILSPIVIPPVSPDLIKHLVEMFEKNMNKPDKK